MTPEDLRDEDLRKADRIGAAAAAVFGVPAQDILRRVPPGGRRSNAVHGGRIALALVLRRDFGWSTRKIGRLMGGLVGDTITALIRSAVRLARRDVIFAARVEALRDALDQFVARRQIMGAASGDKELKPPQGGLEDALRRWNTLNFRPHNLRF